ncbi:MAG: AAA family ATPase [Candidatus Poseidoniales archaeon]|jgi:cell division control protein 6|nr:AAA family ATPase [Candidatus Poseidoniales archaeon]MCH2358360.1 AAA family ATPase [Candidatus Poseidoniales archaeon]
MTGYLDRIGAGKIIRDHAPLTFDYIPDELVGRDAELTKLGEIFTGIEDGRVSCRAVITGQVGSGKTVLSHCFSKDLQRHFAGTRDIRPVHVNCRNHPSKTQVLQRLITALDSGHPERGLGSGEIMQSLRRQLHGNKEHLLLVLDEVDHLLRSDKGDLLYQLLRIDEGLEQAGTLSLIIISQTQVLDLLEPAIISRFGTSNHVHLEVYAAEQLEAIARQRAEAACIEGTVPDGVLRTIGQRAAEIGDARLAIELLEDSAKKAERSGRGEIIPDDVRIVAREVGQTVEPNVVENLTLHAQLSLLSLCRRLRKEDEVTTGDAEKLYHVVCEEYEVEPRSHTTFWKHLKTLEQQQLIESRTANQTSGRGRTQHLSMPAALPGTLEKRVEGAIERSVRKARL